MHKRHPNPIFVEGVDGRDENYDNASINHGDKFQQPKNQRDEGFNMVVNSAIGMILGILGIVIKQVLVSFSIKKYYDKVLYDQGQQQQS